MKPAVAYLFAVVITSGMPGQDVVSGGDNSWIFHTPDDGRSSLYIAPGVPGSGGTYDWSVNTTLRTDGSVSFSGNVGVGTQDGPVNRLFVKGPFTPSYMQLALQATGSDDRVGFSFLKASGARVASFYADANGHSYLNGTELPNGTFHIYSAGSDQITILPNGNIGLGTGSPTVKLDVRGGYVSTTYDNTTVRAFFEGSTGVSYFGNLEFGDVAIGNAHNWRYLVVKDGGNVGIGTTSPTHKLSVNGPGKFKEVIVETTGWSDYVFAPGYDLAPLSEVEAHIKEHRHLPGIPSAKEVAEQGVSIGEMQAKLLAKIEELTLHQIALEKQQRQLAALVTELRAENRDLRDKIAPPAAHD